MQYKIVQVKKLWDYNAVDKWIYKWWICQDPIWANTELSEYCERHNLKLVCVSRGWWHWYATLAKEE